jgi:hypothetical protein
LGGDHHGYSEEEDHYLDVLPGLGFSLGDQVCYSLMEDLQLLEQADYVFSF